MSSLTILKKISPEEDEMAGNLPSTKKYYSRRKIFGFSDEEVRQLPDVSELHLRYKEWRVAKQYCKRLIDYISHKENLDNVLVTTCGNGWLAAQLSAYTSARVTGIDTTAGELQQAGRVFSHIPNLQFAEGDMNAAFLQQKKFEIIVLADCVQYTESLPALLHKTLQHLTLLGETHIITTSLYRQSLTAFRYRILHKPSFFLSGLSFVKNPFYHIVVKNHYL